METYRALYYPFIHFKDDGWLKLAALYWDRVGRIVPATYRTQDSATVRALSSVVEAVEPEWVEPTFDNVFQTFVAENSVKLIEQYGIDQRDNWRVLPKRPPVDSHGPESKDPRLGYIFLEKISKPLREAFLGSGVATVVETANGQWVGMHPKMMSVYMMAMAESVAAMRGYRPLTDETRNHVAVANLSPERLAQVLLPDDDDDDDDGDADAVKLQLVGEKPTSTEIESVLMSVAFKAVVPTGIEQLGVDKILEFREKYPGERAKFQKAAAELVKSSEWLGSITNRATLEQRLRDEYDKTWNVQLADLKEKLRSVGIDTMMGSFNLSTTLPAGLAAIVLQSEVAMDPTGIAATAIVLNAIPMWRDMRKTSREAVSSSEVGYLYRMEEDLEPKELSDWVRGRAREFMLGA